MDLLWKFTDYFMDFQKVRTFQEWCGLREVEYSQGVNGANLNQRQVKATGNQLYDQCQGRNTDLNYRKPNTKCCSEDEKESNIEIKHTECEKKNYVVTNYFLHYLFLFGSLLGHEVFYITIIPVMFWNFDPFVARKMVVVWVVTMYIGQALKDLIKWPRPSWPPVFRLEKRVAAEYGVPSTHAVAGTALPFSILMAMYGRYEFPVEIGIVLALCWCSLVCLSRLYVGMHSILDIMAGVSLTAIYLWLGWPFMEMVDKYTLTTKFSPWIIIMSHFLLGVIYPSTDQYSTSRGDTVIILGAGAGVSCGSWLHYQYGFNFEPVGIEPFEIGYPTLVGFGVGCIRSILGIIMTAIARFASKWLSLSLVCHAVGVSKKDRSARQRKDVEVMYKFVTYTTVAFTATAIAPIAMYQLNLMHSS